MRLIDKIALIYIRDKKILSTRSKGKDVYYIPGGKREADESDLETLTREIMEELSVSVIPSTVEYIGTYEAQAHGHAEGILVRMTCYSSDFSGQLKADNEIDEIVWLTSDDSDKVSPVDKIIFADLRNRGLID